MKKLIILPGNSKRNQAWGEGARDYFGSWFDDVYLQYYDHWQTDSNDMDIETELEKLRQAAGEEIVVFAKSIGTILTLLAVSKGFINPSKCVFFGMPLDYAAEGLLKDNWSPLRDFSTPTLAFHNVDDPTASCSFAEQKLTELSVGAVTFFKVPGDNHNYTEFAEYETEIKNFLQK